MKPELRLEALAAHQKYPGKLQTMPLEELTPENLKLFYTPGVGAVSKHVAEHPEELAAYSMQGNTVAVVSDGSAVLGLGNIGPQGAYPVMEGKAMLFKALGKVDAVPIVLNTQDPDEIVAAVMAIAPSFAGINLEDIAAPKCYDIEKRLQDRLAIPVMHDDQHATAIVVLAGLINAAKVTGRELKTASIVVLGSGAAGSAVIRLLHAYGCQDVIGVDSKGIVEPSRQNMDPNKVDLANLTKPKKKGSMEDALKGAEMVVGLASAGLLNQELVKSMAKDPVVFALSNPDPEILPTEAARAGAAVVATGRSDFPNQINNVLVFPGFFRGAFDHKVRQVTPAIKLAAGVALAGLVEEPTADRIMPSVFDQRVVKTVAEAVGSA